MLKSMRVFNYAYSPPSLWNSVESGFNQRTIDN